MLPAMVFSSYLLFEDLTLHQDKCLKNFLNYRPFFDIKTLGLEMQQNIRLFVVFNSCGIKFLLSTWAFMGK